MHDLFPKDRLRQFLMALFLVLAVIELSRGSFIWVAIDIIFAASFSPKVRILAQYQWYRIFKR
jgi:hypothetical protein